MLINRPIQCIFIILFCGLWKADGILTRNVTPLGKKVLCVPKTRWFEQCNWCVCSVDGNVKTCTDVICIRDDMTPIPIHPAIVRRQASSDNNSKTRFFRKGSKGFKLKKPPKPSNRKGRKYKLDRSFAALKPVSDADSEAV